MGLLDDAIREHLDLKRKHGAAEEELQRKETEALGPARRDFTAADAPPEEAVATPVPDAPSPAPADRAEPAGWLDEEPAAAPFDESTDVPVEAREESLEHAAEAADEAVAQEPLVAPDPVAPREEPAETPPQRAGDTPARGLPAVGADDEPEGEEEDVLEETPDFLQDTPEHDRLWFEQKPPRDFDFDD